MQHFLQLFFNNDVGDLNAATSAMTADERLSSKSTVRLNHLNEWSSDVLEIISSAASEYYKHIDHIITSIGTDGFTEVAPPIDILVAETVASLSAKCSEFDALFQGMIFVTQGHVDPRVITCDILTKILKDLRSHASGVGLRLPFPVRDLKF